MFKCATCKVPFNDGVQCDGCDKRLDFGCAQISEKGYRRLGADRRAAWRCPQCKSLASPRSIPTATAADVALDDSEKDEPASIALVLFEVREMKKQLCVLPKLLADVRSIKQEISNLKEACEFNSTKIDEHAERIGAIDREIISLRQTSQLLESTRIELRLVKEELEAKEQWSRLNNVEIKGVPVKKTENLFETIDSISKAIGYNLPKSQINYISRVPMQATKEKLIIVGFSNRYVKEEFVTAARINKTLFANDIPGFQGANQRVFINDHLTPTNKKLLTSVKNLAKEKQYQFVWVKYGKIHIRKNDTSNVFIISKEGDLNKIV